MPVSPISLANLTVPKPGEIRNPAGNPRTSGTFIKEWLNSFAIRELSRKDIEAISKDDDAPWTKRMAAIRVLRTMENPDMADFEPVLDGQKSLTELRTDGKDTRVVKKMKQKERFIPQKDGEAVREVEREIELHDRSGEDFDRVMDRTEGKPNQSITGIETNVTVNILKVEFDT